MDISQQSQKISQSSTAQKPQSSAPLANEQKAVSNLKALQLKPEQIYIARVQQRLSPPTAPVSTQDTASTATQPTTIPTANTQQATMPATTQTQQQINEWLISLNGRILKVATEKALQIGQTLQIKLDPNSSPTAPSLVVQIKVPPTLPPTQAQQLSNEALTEILNSMHKILPKQISINKGLQALFTPPADTAPSIQASTQASAQPSNSKIENSQATSRSSSRPHQLTQQIQSILLSSLPKLNDIVSNDSAEKTINAMRTAIGHSGLLFEHSSTLNASNMAQFKKSIEQLQQYFQKPTIQPQNTQQQGTQLQSTQLQGSTPQNLNQIAQQSTAPVHTAIAAKAPPLDTNTTSLHQGLDKQQSNLLSALQNAMRTAILPKASHKPPEIADLKSLLFSVSAAIIKNMRAETNQAPPLDSFLNAFSQNELLLSPFNFPNLNAKVSANAKSLLAGQEFTTGQLLKLFASMLNRVHFNQLNSLLQSQAQSNENSTVQSWFLELPIVTPENQIDTVSIRIDKDEAGNQTEAEDPKQEIQWKLVLSFDFKDLGPIYIQASLIPPSVSSIIWADKEETLSLIKNEVPHFKTRLQELGLDVGDIFCQKGQPKQQQTKLDRSLVDIQA